MRIRGPGFTGRVFGMPSVGRRPDARFGARVLPPGFGLPHSAVATDDTAIRQPIYSEAPKVMDTVLATRGW